MSTVSSAYPPVFDLEGFRLDVLNGNPQDFDDAASSSVPDSVQSSGEQSAQTVDVATETVVSSVGSSAPTLANRTMTMTDRDEDGSDTAVASLATSAIFASNNAARVAPLVVNLQPEDVGSNAPSAPTFATFTTLSAKAKRPPEMDMTTAPDGDNSSIVAVKECPSVIDDDITTVVSSAETLTTRASTVGVKTVDLMAEHMDGMSIGADTLPSFATFATKSAEKKKRGTSSLPTVEQDGGKVSPVLSIHMPSPANFSLEDDATIEHSSVVALKEQPSVIDDDITTVVSGAETVTTRASTVGVQTVDLMAEHMDGMSIGASTLPSFATFTTKSAQKKKMAASSQASPDGGGSETSRVSSVLSIPNIPVDDPSVLTTDDISAAAPPKRPSALRNRNSASSVGGSTAVSALSMNGAPTVAGQQHHKRASALKNSRSLSPPSANTSRARASRTSSVASSIKPIRRVQQQQPQQSRTMKVDEDDGLSVDHHYASDMALLGGVLGREDMTSGLEDVVGSFLRRGAMVGVGIWLSLLFLVLLLAPGSAYQYSSGPEQMANATLLVLLIGVNFSRVGPYLVSDRKNNWKFLTGGAMMASCTVQFIAITSVSIMFLFPAPVIVDVMGVRCHLVRWAEWTALAFVMCFLTESIDLPLEGADSKHAWMTAIAIALSTVCGGIMGFCKTEFAWWFVFIVSWILFCVLFVRLSWRGTRLLTAPKPVTTAEKEDYERAKYSFKLMSICTVIWTILALAWSIVALMYKYAEPGSIWSNDWLILCVENTCEALSKIGYLSILLEVHEVLFDEASKTARRLGELRAYMSAVWDVSTDVVIVCSSHDHLVNAAVSPAFYKMETGFGYHLSGREKILADANPEQTTLVMEVDPYEGSYRTFEIDLSKPMSRQEASTMLKSNRSKARMVAPVFEKNLKVLSDLVCDATTFAGPGAQKQYTMRQEFFCVDRNRKEEVMQVDAKVVRLKDKTVLIVLRDVTERGQATTNNGSSQSLRKRRRGSSRTGSRDTLKAQNPAKSVDDESDDGIAEMVEELAAARASKSHQRDDISDDGIREMMAEVTITKAKRSLRDDASDDGIREMRAEVAAAKASSKKRSQQSEKLEKDLRDSVEQVFGSLHLGGSASEVVDSLPEETFMERQAKEMRSKLFASLPDENSVATKQSEGVEESHKTLASSSNEVGTPKENSELQETAPAKELATPKENSEPQETAPSIEVATPKETSEPQETRLSKESPREDPFTACTTETGVDSSSGSFDVDKPSKKKSKKSSVKRLYRKVMGSKK